MTPLARTAACTAPYLAWMALMAVLPAGAATYAARTACSAILLAACAAAFRPRRCGLGALAWGLAAGLAVFALWTWPERFEWYRELFVFGSGAAAPSQSPYDPSVCGWPLALVRLAGSAFVIAAAEELFFRHFLYRWLQSRNWEGVPHANFDISAFLWTTALFALEHDRWLAGAAAGAIYCLAYIRQGLWAAIVAHVVTNLALGIYVLRNGLWAFW